MPTSEIRAEWAAQRIRGLSLWRGGARRALGAGGGEVRSLIEEFHYPRLGPGPDVGADGRRDRRRGRRGARSARRSTAIDLGDGPRRGPHAGGERDRGRGVISSLPLRTLAGDRRPAAAAPRCSRPPPACATATSSRVALVLDGEDRSPTTGSTSTIPACASAGSRTSAPGARTWSPTRAAPASASSTSASRATSSGTRPTTSWSRARPRELDATRPRARGGRRRPATSSGSRRPIRSTTPATRSASATMRAWLDGLDGLDADRPQRPAPLQQLRPLDADRDARGRERLRRRARTTSGR